MEWINALRGTVVALDTAPLIYLIEENPIYLRFVRPFFEAVDRGEVSAVTSVLTLTEVLVHPMRHGDQDLADHYRQILLYATHVSTVPVSELIAERAAELRARHGLRTPDAIHLATAVHSGASSFLTNDGRLPSLASLKMLLLSQFVTTTP